MTTNYANCANPCKPQCSKVKGTYHKVQSSKFKVQCSKFEFILHFWSGKGEEWSRKSALLLPL